MKVRYLKEKPEGNFREIKNHKSYYVSDKGVLMHHITEGKHKDKYTILKTKVMKNKGYYGFLPTSTLIVDRTVYRAFIDDNLQYGDKIIHKDGNWLNNDPDNLEKTTFKDYLTKYPYKNHVKVVDENGNVYSSMMDASRNLYTSNTTIKNYLKDGYKGRLEINVKRTDSDD